FAQLASEFDTLDELKVDLRQQVARTKGQNRAIQARDLLLQALVDGTEIPVPAGVVEAEVTRHLEAEDRVGDEAHAGEVREDATVALRNQILLDTLAEGLQVKVNQGELVDYMINTARQYGMDPSTFIQTLDQQGRMPAMVAEVARSKALAMALRHVTVLGPDGEPVDLTEYIGTDEGDATTRAAADEVVQAAGTSEAEPELAPVDTDAVTDISAMLRP
ncbi:MAG: trigger factor, partial [Micrococcales bacterium]|nr:trigger factor [Micrococcales bacterium]